LINTLIGVLTMAKIVEEVVAIKLSKLVKNTEENSDIVTADLIAALEQVSQELISDSVVVEVEILK
jgi:hypothetical protein